MRKDKIIHLDTAAATTAETIVGQTGATGSPSTPGSHPGSDFFGKPGTGPGSAGGPGVPEGSAGDTTVFSNPANLPQRIGRYEIKRLIGAGGMGAVYEAIQDQPRRTVALKVMRSAVASPAALRRFEYESQLLAKLRHPAIAQVYDAGTHQDALTMQSVPYFAMEYVPDARPLSSYAEESRLTLRQRLELFNTVCDAVQHGHQRGVIHRDLKPANILVDQQGGVKIIDFGVARSAEGEGGAVMTQHTSVGQLVGTLQYMAPEQCGADTTDIDSRADVYALGVTLYELLTGKVPYELSGRSLGEAVRIVREAPPVPPSARSAELRGDVETIILKTLEKDPGRRYDSASALAADVQRFLDSEPILARRIGVWGKSVRWVKRNRAVATVAGMGILVLSVTSVVLVSKILVESHRATQNLAVASENLELIKDVFTSMRPDLNQKGMVDVGVVLDAAAARLDKNPPKYPAVEADFRELLGGRYRDLQQFSKAIPQQKRVLDIREQIYPEESLEVAKSLHDLGAALWFGGQYAEADEAYTKSLAIRKKLHGEKHAEVATSMTHLAAVRLRQGKLADAEDLYKQALEMRRELLPPGSPELAQSVNNFAKCVLLRGSLDEAEKLFRQALEMITASNGERDLQTAFASHNLAGCLLEKGDAAGAEEYFRKALDIRAEKFPPTNLLVTSSRLGLARAKFLGPLTVARSLGDDPSRKSEADAAVNGARAALNEAKGALATMENTMPADHPDVASASIVLGRMHLDLGEAEAAEPYLRRAQSIYKDPARSAMWELSESRLYLGKCLSMLRRDEEAEAMLRQSVESLASNQAPTRLREQARNELAAFYEARGRSTDAAKVRSGELFPTH